MDNKQVISELEAAAAVLMVRLRYIFLKVLFTYIIEYRAISA